MGVIYITSEKPQNVAVLDIIIHHLIINKAWWMQCPQVDTNDLFNIPFEEMQATEH